jgi:GTP-binding protein YchF
MQICIIGLPSSGKSTIFNALTRGRTEAGSHSPSGLAPVIGITKVPDDRLEKLKSFLNPGKVVPAEIKYVDIAGLSQSTSSGKGIYGPFLNYLSSADALIQVVRAFENDQVPHISGSVNPKRDIDEMDLELVFSDLTIIDHRLERIEVSLKGAKAQEKDLLIKEKTLLHKIKEALEKEIPIWKQELGEEELKSLSNYQFLTAKPMLIVINISENQIGKAKEIENELRSSYSHSLFDVLALSGEIEMELSQLDEADAIEFRNSMGLKLSAIEHIISASYNLLGLVSFFTTASSELKAWTVTRDTTALKAAGKIHTDMERGFIRAEVISYEDMGKASGNIHEARKHGLLRLEGKNYLIQDGDIVTFLFNV